MNYLKELNMFYQRIDTENIPANAILLWYTLMSIANSLCWKEEFSVPLSLLESKTKLHKSTICRMRDLLLQRGFINYRSIGGKACAIYKLNSLELQLELRGATPKDLVSQIELHKTTQDNEGNNLVSHSATVTATIHKHKTISNKENIKRKSEVGAQAPPLPINSTPERKEKSCAKKEKRSPPPLFEVGNWLSGLDPPWQELMQTWLEYKCSRKERYKSELSVAKCLAQLKRLSGGRSQMAQQIIDQSIANNWAGLFELKRQAYYPRGTPTPATGQHVGQIKQPESEEHKRRILEKFGQKNN